jgi:hypothetical protein
MQQINAVAKRLGGSGKQPGIVLLGRNIKGPHPAHKRKGRPLAEAPLG